MAATQYSHIDPSLNRPFAIDQFLDASICDWLDGGLDDFGGLDGFNYKSNLDCPWPTLDEKSSDGSPKDGESARPHYATEKKYRQRLNDKFKALERGLTDVDRPLSSQLAREKSKFMEALQAGRNGRSVKQRKSLVLALALEYVRSLESKYKQTSTEIETYQQLLYRSAAQLANALMDEGEDMSQ